MLQKAAVTVKDPTHYPAHLHAGGASLPGQQYAHCFEHSTDIAAATLTALLHYSRCTQQLWQPLSQELTGSVRSDSNGKSTQLWNES